MRSLFFKKIVYIINLNFKISLNMYILDLSNLKFDKLFLVLLIFKLKKYIYINLYYI